MKAKHIISLLVCILLIGTNVKECHAELKVSLFGSEKLRNEADSDYYQWLEPAKAVLQYPTINGEPSENNWTVKTFKSNMTAAMFTAQMQKNHIIMLRAHDSSSLSWGESGKIWKY